jgi:hypothetical protein
LVTLVDRVGARTRKYSAPQVLLSDATSIQVGESNDRMQEIAGRLGIRGPSGHCLTITRMVADSRISRKIQVVDGQTLRILQGADGFRNGTVYRVDVDGGVVSLGPVQQKKPPQPTVQTLERSFLPPNLLGPNTTYVVETPVRRSIAAGDLLRPNRKLRIDCESGESVTVHPTRPYHVSSVTDTTLSLRGVGTITHDQCRDWDLGWCGSAAWRTTGPRAELSFDEFGRASAQADIEIEAEAQPVIDARERVARRKAVPRRSTRLKGRANLALADFRKAVSATYPPRPGNGIEVLRSILTACGVPTSARAGQSEARANGTTATSASRSNTRVESRRVYERRNESLVELATAYAENEAARSTVIKALRGAPDHRRTPTQVRNDAPPGPPTSREEAKIANARPEKVPLVRVDLAEFAHAHLKPEAIPPAVKTKAAAAIPDGSNPDTGLKRSAPDQIPVGNLQHIAPPKRFSIEAAFANPRTQPKQAGKPSVESIGRKSGNFPAMPVEASKPKASGPPVTEEAVEPTVSPDMGM